MRDATVFTHRHKPVKNCGFNSIQDTHCHCSRDPLPLQISRCNVFLCAAPTGLGPLRQARRPPQTDDWSASILLDAILDCTIPFRLVVAQLTGCTVVTVSLSARCDDCVGRRAAVPTEHLQVLDGRVVAIRCCRCELSLLALWRKWVLTHIPAVASLASRGWLHAVSPLLVLRHPFSHTVADITHNTNSRTR